MSEQNTRERILELLVGHDWVSGQSLADGLGISRTAVWKHVQALQESGVRIEQARGRGYRLAASQDLLDMAVIREAIGQTGFSDSLLTYRMACDSTNTLARDLLRQTAAPQVLVMAEQQHAGRGRLGRDWVSPLAAHLYLSVGFFWSRGYETLGGLSLAVGTCVAEALQPCSRDPLTLKWPNDIHARGAKLSGILVELEGEHGGDVRVVLGIGINIHHHGHMDRVDQPWMTLDRLTDRTITRTEVAVSVLSGLAAGLSLFRDKGWPAFLERWAKFDHYKGQPVEIRDVHGSLMSTGVYQGVDASGSLCLQTTEGMRRIHSGEVSLRVQS